MYQEKLFPLRKSVTTIQKTHFLALTQAACMTVQLLFKSAELLFC